MCYPSTAAQLVGISSAVRTRSTSARLWAEALSSSCRTQKSGKGVADSRVNRKNFRHSSLKKDNCNLHPNAKVYHHPPPRVVGPGGLTRI